MIGILPAAGSAVRMLSLPKMLLPTPYGTLIAVMRDRMQNAGARHVVIGTRAVIAPLLEPLQDGIGRLYRAETDTMSETVLLAREYIDTRQSVLFGMADTYFDDALAFHKLEVALHGGADIAVGVFRTRPQQHQKLGMCRIENGRVVDVVDKPVHTDLTHAWGVMAWRPVFWDFLRASDPHVGYGLPHAIQAGLDVRAVELSGGYYDCGTPNEYFELIHHLTREEVHSR